MALYDYDYASWLNSTDDCANCDQRLPLAGPISVALLSLFGLVGNLSIMYLVLRHKKLRNAPNILIINLTMGDLLYILSAATFFIEKEISPSWEGSIQTCRLKAYVEDVGQSMCVFSLAALSRERYLAIVCGIETRRRRGSCSANSLCAVAVVVTASFLLGIFSIFSTSYTPSSKHCNQLPKHEVPKMAFVSLRTLLCYVLPLCIISCYYVRIARSLYQSLEQFGESESHAHQSRLRKRLAWIVLFMTVLFAIFWLPHFVNLHVKAYAPQESFYMPYPSYLDYLRIISFLMALTNSCSNPWIVFVMSSKHRQHCCLFQSMCSKKRFRRGQALGTTRLTTLTGTTRRTSTNVSQMSHV